MICSSLYLLVLISIILQVDGLLGNMTGTVYGGQVSPVRVEGLDRHEPIDPASRRYVYRMATAYNHRSGIPVATVYDTATGNHLSKFQSIC